MKSNNIIKLKKINISKIKSMSSQSSFQTIELSSSINRQKQLNYNPIFPQLNKSWLKKETLENNSILTKFIHQKTSSLIKQTKKDLNIIRSRDFNSLFSSNVLSEPKEKITRAKLIKIPKRKTVQDIKSVLISDKSSIIENENENDKSNTINQIKKQDETLFDDKEINNDILPTKCSSIKVTNPNPLTTNNDLNLSEANINNDNKNSTIISSSIIKSRRIFKPNNQFLLKIKETKKINFSIGNIRRLFYMDIKFQSKTINEQINLIEESIREYRNCYETENFVTIFKAMSSYNKKKYISTVDEINKILLITPKLFLREYYKLMFGLKENIKPKLIKDEELEELDDFEKLEKKNELMNEINEYFKKSFEFYLIIITQVEQEEIVLKRKDYIKIISYYENVRNNLCFLVNFYKNAERNYEEDKLMILKILDNRVVKLTKDDVNKLEDLKVNVGEILKDIKNKRENKASIIDRIKGQFVFKQNLESEKLYRINKALVGISDYGTMEKTKRKTKEFKSIFNSRILDRLLNYCDEKTKAEIISNQVRYEGKRNHSKEFKPIKIHL